MGTKAEDIKNVLEKISLEKRNLVKEVTLDMAKNKNFIWGHLTTKKPP